MAPERFRSPRRAAHALALRTRIVLSCAASDQPSNESVATRLGFNKAKVGKWRRRFIAERLDGPFDDPRPGAPRRISDDKVKQIVVRTLEAKLKDATRWSTRSMAKAAGVSPDTCVGRIWSAFGLKPHLVEYFKLSSDPLFIEKVRDVVGLYLGPPERAVVPCVDKKSQIEELNRAQLILPMMPAVPERRSHDHVRQATSIPPRPSRHGVGQGHRVLARAPSSRQAQEVPRAHRTRGPSEPCRPPHPRQSCDAQGTGDQAVARAPPPVLAPLFPHELVLARPGRAVVRRADDEEDPPRGRPIASRAREGHQGLDRPLERGPETVRLGDVRRSDPRRARSILRANF